MDKSKQKYVLRYFQQVVVISDVTIAVLDQKSSERPNPYLRNWNDQPKCIKKGRIRPNYKTDPRHITKIVVVYLLFFQSILTATFLIHCQHHHHSTLDSQKGFARLTRLWFCHTHSQDNKSNSWSDWFTW